MTNLFVVMGRKRERQEWEEEAELLVEAPVEVERLSRSQTNTYHFIG